MDFILGPFAWLTAALSIVGWVRTIKGMRGNTFRTPNPITDMKQEWRSGLITGLIMIISSVLIVGWLIGQLLSMLLSENFALVLVVGTLLAACQLALGVLTLMQTILTFVETVSSSYAKVWLDYERSKLS